MPALQMINVEYLLLDSVGGHIELQRTQYLSDGKGPLPFPHSLSWE